MLGGFSPRRCYQLMLTRILAHKLPLILLIAAAVRLGVLLAFPDVFAFEATGAVHGSDAYDAYAQNLLATGVYGREAGVPDAAIPPLYSYALALVYGVFGRGHIQVGLFHILLDMFSIAALYLIGKCLFPYSSSPSRSQYKDWTPALAALFAALYPYLIFQNLTLIDTPLFMALLFAFLLAMVLLRDRPALDSRTWALAAAGGLALGAGMLTRPIVPPLAVLVAVWFLFRLNLRQTVLRLLPVAVVGTLVVVPWIARNYAVFNAFVPMTTTSGANFWQGNSRYTVPFFRAGYDVQWTAPELTTADLQSREADAERFALAFQYLRGNPEKIPELLWVKFLVHWSLDIAPRYNPQPGERLGLDNNGQFIIQRVDDSGQLLTYGPNDPVAAYDDPLFDVIGRTIHRFYWGGLFLLGLAGGVLALRCWRDTSLLWFVQISMTAVYVFFHPSTRYRVPTDPLWFLFSAYALVWLWTWWQQRKA
ncbi:MAG: glycosyltransferase family 39 protein [Chloroflexi bacterium]|nr:glycosyltransferase family 39 protein [Chloroflexota bacterium]